MLIKTLQNNIARIQRDFASLAKQLGEESKKNVNKNKQINQIERSIHNSTSISTLQSKQNQIFRLSEEVARIQSKKADISKKISDKTGQLHKYQLDLQKEQEKERKKIEQSEKKREKQKLAYLQSITKELASQKALENKIQSLSVSSEHGTIEYDVFISYAKEDNEEFVRPLAEELKNLGYRVWYDEFELSVGDSLRKKIDQGLSNSRYGVVVLSTSFFAKNWPQYELDGLVAREMQGSKVILPIWHKVSKDEVLSYSPALADKVALNSSILSIKEIAIKLGEVLEKK